MGKSPGKWIKSVLFGKKTSKSTTSGKERIANEKDILAAAKGSEVDVAFDPPVASYQTSNAININEGKLYENREAANSSTDKGTSFPRNQYTDPPGSAPQDASYDPQKIIQEKAAALAQAAFRGYLARRAFRALKGIIRLQALIRGHLVRRQAVATLCCVLKIVKLQAHVRGRKVRASDIGLEVRKACTLVRPLEGKLVDSAGVNACVQIAKLSSNSLVRKLLATSPAVMPLRKSYEIRDPNSASNWLELWSASHIWKTVTQPKNTNSKCQGKQKNSHTVGAETGRPKRSVRRVPTASFDSISVQGSSEPEKPKRNLRQVQSHPVEQVQENPQLELVKVKRNLRKVHNPIVEVPIESQVETEKPNQTLEKVSNGHDISEQRQSVSSLSEKLRREAILTESKPDSVETTPEPLLINGKCDSSDGDQAAEEINGNSENIPITNGNNENISITNGEVRHKEDSKSNENQKSSKKSSAQAKQECEDNGLQSSPALPSYMAATESAKAKLRLQGSPRVGQDGAEKNATRRHSLPSATNNKISSQSPRTQRPVHSGGKGEKKGDKPRLSSRDGNAKVSHAEWKR